MHLFVSGLAARVGVAEERAAVIVVHREIARRRRHHCGVQNAPKAKGSDTAALAPGQKKPWKSVEAPAVPWQRAMRTRRRPWLHLVLRVKRQNGTRADGERIRTGAEQISSARVVETYSANGPTTSSSMSNVRARYICTKGRRQKKQVETDEKGRCGREVGKAERAAHRRDEIGSGQALGALQRRHQQPAQNETLRNTSTKTTGE